MKEFTVLTINPGSSSTKMGVVKGDKVIVNREVDHHKEDFAECKTFGRSGTDPYGNDPQSTGGGRDCPF